MMKPRRFVNLVWQNWADGVYSLRRMDANKHLFYPSTREALDQAANNKKKKYTSLRRLPDIICSFDPSPTDLASPGMEWFELFSPRRDDGSTVVASNTADGTFMFNSDKRLFLTLPRLSQCKGTLPVSFSITHPGANKVSLHVMDRLPRKAFDQPSHGKPTRSCFEVLGYDPFAKDICDSGKGWWWRVLPPPPFIDRQPPAGDKPVSLYDRYYVGSYTTVKNADGCFSIYISSSNYGTNDHGTYCFRTACLDPTHRLGWRHLDEWEQVGEWTLPFEGRAEYVPELDLCLGFTAGGAGTYNHLCAVDLSTIDPSRAPTPQQVWEDLTLPEENKLGTLFARVINMGDNRFCIAKTYTTKEFDKYFALLTGIEIERCQDGQSLGMVQHKRIRYMSKTGRVKWVL